MSMNPESGTPPAFGGYPLGVRVRARRLLQDAGRFVERDGRDGEGLFEALCNRVLCLLVSQQADVSLVEAAEDLLTPRPRDQTLQRSLVKR